MQLVSYQAYFLPADVHLVVYHRQCILHQLFEDAIHSETKAQIYIE